MTETKQMMHTPVLLQEVLDALQLAPGMTIVDGTVGYGGHAEKILEKILPGGQIIGLDLDADALKATQERLAKASENVRLFQTQSHNMARAAERCGKHQVDGILLDLGLSSGELATDHRGFSFERSGLLDMRFGTQDVFDPFYKPQTAAHLLNTSSEKELVSMLRNYGEERYAVAIARSIIQKRHDAKLQTTDDLVDAIVTGYRGKPKPLKIHMATRTFQAVRIAVNHELENLEKSLHAAVSLLKPGGRIAVLSFHSLEDRMVKHFFRQAQKGCVCPPEFPVCRCGNVSTLKVITPKPLTPQPEEISLNPRSRSAKLRVAEKPSL